VRVITECKIIEISLVDTPLRPEWAIVITESNDEVD
jgi:hypothetical protein